MTTELAAETSASCGVLAPVLKSQTSRLMRVAKWVQPAPWYDSLPTSSLSKRAMTRHCGSFSRSGAVTRASRAQKVEAKLSKRGANTNSSNAPPTTAGCVSHRLRSKSRMSPASQPSLVARMSSNTGWCLGLSPDFAGPEFSSAMMLVQRMGQMWSSLLILRAARSSALCRWMQRLGIFRRGLSTWTRRGSIVPPRRTMTRPATVRSRSNHVCHRPPPYVATLTCCTPAFPVADTGLIWKLGESVWAPMIFSPLGAWYLPPTAKAIMELLLRMK
mmetsp:Transcript_4186/g.7373  ORF Transcript_4186/g.7373 Transcript_4186/m.7373 type:complete len:274 (-) Transcript_4186:185-1006(-)